MFERARHLISLLLLVGMLTPLAGCEMALTKEEALEALDEAALAGQAEILVGASVEITTNFTLGQAVEAAAQEIAAFVESQLPCAAIDQSGATLSITYGVTSDSCEYKGQSYSGSHEITVVSTGDGNVEVHHVWTDFSNQVITVSGEATVTWSEAFSSRHIVHTLRWRRLKDNREATGFGDRTQSALGGLWTSGVAVDGQRSWEGESGKWDLDIDDVAWRWIDPVPEAGTYTLDTPFDKSASFIFMRADEDTITVLVESGEREFSFDVTRTGVVESD